MVWITVNETAELLEITDSAILKSIAKYQHKKVTAVGRGGKKILISLDSLPNTAQSKYYVAHPEIELPALDLTDFEGKYTKNQKEEANYKAHVIRCFWRSGESANKFLAKYNVEQEQKITLRQLYEWQRKFKESGQNTESLIDSRGGYNKGTCSIPAEAWDQFCYLYMTEQQRTIKLCYDLTKKEYPTIPSIGVFERKVKKIPKLALKRRREGPEALNNCLPYMERDKSMVYSNDIWDSDHHTMNLMGKTKNGKVRRLYLTAWADIRSTKILSWVIRVEDPNTTVIKKTLRLAMEEYGVPKEVYTDNGKDYKAKEFSQEYPDSIISILGINKIYATPYHGQAKPIERFWRTTGERFCKLFYSYIGDKTENRPEHMKKTNKELEKDPNIPTIEYITEVFKGYVKEYNSLPHGGDGMDGKSPDQIYYENLKDVKRIENKDALKLLCGKIIERIVRNNGIKIFDTFFFNYDGLLARYFSKKVKVCYDPDDLETIFVFDMDFRFIC
ncbi:MAG: Mu transposase C-terminal domain-containing protein, partial [Oscillospiraceae bacterium]|nr:Mu transposase C-terminal domain-containing protein [Oscillospiraceae bacterium]